MSVSKRMKRGYLLNRMWNLKVEAIHDHVVQLQSLLKDIEFKRLELEDITTTLDMNEVLEELFTQVIGRFKAMGGG